MLSAINNQRKFSNIRNRSNLSVPSMCLVKDDTNHIQEPRVIASVNNNKDKVYVPYYVPFDSELKTLSQKDVNCTVTANNKCVVN